MSLERFFKKVEITDKCWIWKGTKIYSGYGTFRFQKRQILAHRISYEFFVDCIPKGMQIHHICNNRLCVNPNHLECVTRAYNLKEVRRETVTHCKRGHQLTPDNVYYHAASKTRRCRKCKNVYLVNFYKKKHEKEKSQQEDSYV